MESKETPTAGVKTKKQPVENPPNVETKQIRQLRSALSKSKHLVTKPPAVQTNLKQVNNKNVGIENTNIQLGPSPKGKRKSVHIQVIPGEKRPSLEPLPIPKPIQHSFTPIIPANEIKQLEKASGKGATNQLTQTGQESKHKNKKDHNLHHPDLHVDEHQIIPLGFLIIPTDSEPRIERSDAYVITWWQCCYLRTCSSVIFFESCLIYFFLPFNLILGAVFLIWSTEEKEQSRILFLDYSPMSVNNLTTLITMDFLVTTVLLSFATALRRGMFIILTTFSIVVGLVLLCLLSMFLVVHSSGDEMEEYLEEIFDTYRKEGQEKLTKLTDLINRRFECCGVKNVNYWRDRRTNNGSWLPRSCCESYYFRDTKLPGCYYTQNRSDVMYWTQHKQGCEIKLVRHFRKGSKLQWVYVALGLVILIMCLVFTTLYLIRKYASLSNHVHPKIRTLVDEIVEKAEDEIFDAYPNNRDNFDEDVKDFVRFNLSRCHTIDEVQQFLSAAADVRSYIRNLEPGDFARDILSRNEDLLSKFEIVLKRLADKKLNLDRQVSSGNTTDPEKLMSLQRATRNWKNMTAKIVQFKRFSARANEYLELNSPKMKEVRF